MKTYMKSRKNEGDLITLLIIICMFMLLIMMNEAYAGDKEEAELKLQSFNLQAQNIGLQKQLLIKDMDQWKKLDEQMNELNKQVQVFQKDLASKGLIVNEQGKVVDKPAEKK